MATEEKTGIEILDEARESESAKMGVRELAAKFGRGVICAVIGALFGLCGLPFSAYPFGIALLAAADRKVIYIFIGVCASALAYSEQPILLVSAYAAVLLIRTVSRLTLDPPRRDGTGHVFYSENLLLRMATASLGGFIIGLYELMSGGFLYYDLFGALIYVIGTPVAVFLLYGVFNQSGVEGRLYYAASALIVALSVFGARGLEIYGISLSALLAMGISLYVVARRGAVTGIAASVVAGLAHSPLYAPVFIFAALMYGALRSVSALFAAIAAFVAGIAWGVYVGGVGAISSLLSALLSAALIIGISDKLFLAEKKEKAETEEEPAAETVEEPPHAVAVDGGQIAEIKAEELTAELGSIVGAFSELSRLFFDIGERMKKPLTADIRQICDRAFDASCASCRNRSRCWDENYTEMIAAINSMSAEIHRSGRLDEGSVPQTLVRSCERIGDITAEIKHNTARHSAELLLFDKSEIFALDYAAVAELIASGVKRSEREYELDGELSRRIVEELSSLGEGVLSASVYGKERKKAIVLLREREAFDELSEELKKSAARVLGREVDVELTEDTNGALRCVFAPRAQYAIEVARSSVRAASEETYCGDTLNVFSPEPGMQYALISDGMGSGADAALSSRITAVFMEKILRAGGSCKIAMKMLNGFLRNKGGGSLHECSATLDLLEADLVRGTARIYKCGAAPTYVFRSGELFKLSSKTLPLGILGEVDTKKLRFEMKAGDVIVMVSDGVTQGREECPWLYDLLRKTIDAESIERAVELIVERAARESGADDISVVALKVSENRE